MGDPAPDQLSRTAQRRERHVVQRLPRRPVESLQKSVGLRVITLLNVPVGRHELEIRHIGYGVRTAQVETRPGTTTSIELELEPKVLSVEPLTVRVEYRPAYLERVGFYERRLNLGRAVGGASGCDMQVIIDGHLDRVGLLSSMSASEIAGVEVFTGPYRIPNVVREAGADPFCTTIIIWTKHGSPGSRWPRREVVLCTPPLGAQGDDATRVLEGIVRDRLTGVVLPGATVRAWVEGARAARQEWTATTNESGRYRFCDLDPHAPIHLFASFAGRTGGLASVEPGAGERQRKDLTVRVSGTPRGSRRAPRSPS